MSEAKAVLLAAGLGTRLKPLTDRIPKCLAPIAGNPLLDYWLETLQQAGITQVLINTHTFPEQVRAYIAKRNHSGSVALLESYEPVLLGSAGTIAANPDFAKGTDEIIIVYADNLSDMDITGLLGFHRSHPDPITMALFRAENPRQCGIAAMDSNDRIIDFTEKPEHPKSDLANAGVYAVDALAYQEIAALHAFDFGFDVLPKYVGRMRGWLWEGYHRDIGTPEAYEQAQQDAARIFGG